MNAQKNITDSVPLTRADELRSYLSRLESQVGRLGYGAGQGAIDIPDLFDRAHSILHEYKQAGHPLLEEQIRFDEVSAQFRQKTKQFLTEIGGVQALITKRKQRNPDSSRSWWYVDQQLADQRKSNITKTARLAGIVLIVLVIGALVYQRFLAPDKATVQQITYIQAAEQMAQEGNFQQALINVNQALRVVPGDPETLVFKGILQQSLGQKTDADQTFAQAEKALNSLEQFLLLRGQRYYTLNQNEAALGDAQAAIHINPDSSEGYLLAGEAYENLGKFQEALSAYQKASSLSEAQNNASLDAFVRMRLAMLMQRLNSPVNQP